MRRLLPALLVAALLAPPALAWAHDPLDDVSGEEELNQKRNDDDDKGPSQRVAKQQVEFSKELQERDDTEFTLNQEKEEFLRDRAETKDVLEAQRRRNALHGGPAGRSHESAPKPQPEAQPSGEADSPKANPDPQPRGDVDPTAVGDAKADVEGAPSDAPKKGKKKKH